MHPNDLSAHLESHDTRWANRIPVAEGQVLVVQCRPPRKGERYLVGENMLEAEHDWSHVNLLVVVSDIEKERIQ